MTSTPRALIPTLRHLYRLNKDSERGFESVAEHVKSRALKVLLKSYAHRRAQFAAELYAVLEPLGAVVPARGSLPAMLHRGWIDIKAAMTIGRENVEQVVVTEAERGESVAYSRYQTALSAAYPTWLEEILQRQAAEIVQTRDYLRELAGIENDRLVVQLFDTPDAANHALHLLTDAGVNQTQVEMKEFGQIAEEYHCGCQRSRVMETGLTGSLLGMALGIVLGLFAGIVTVAGHPFGMAETVLVTTVVGGLGGLLLGGLFGLLIGQATVEEDDFIYEQSLHRGSMFVSVKISPQRRREIRRLLRTLHLTTAAAT